MLRKIILISAFVIVVIACYTIVFLNAYARLGLWKAIGIIIGIAVAWFSITAGLLKVWNK